MSYAVSGALQAAVFAALSGDAALAALVGSAIYDAVPAGTVPDLYVRLGTETVREASDGSGAGAVHLLTVSVITTNPGFARAAARRIDAASARQIDLRFRARVSDD